MMTESEFKVHMTAYMQRLTTPIRHQLKQIEQRLNRIERIINGDILPAFPYTNKDNNSSLSDQLTANKKEDITISESSDEEEPFIIETYLKLIHEDVSMIKDFIGEYKHSYY